MSHPFSAKLQPPSEMFYPPLDKPQGKDRVYAVGYMVWGLDPEQETGGCDWILGVYPINSDSIENAEVEVMKWLKWTYPECSGYLRHRVKSQPVPDAQLEQAGYCRK